MWLEQRIHPESNSKRGLELIYPKAMERGVRPHGGDVAGYMAPGV